MQSNLNDAISYSRIGWHVFPCRADTKAPMVKGGFKSASTDESQLTEWWTQWPTAAIGVACMKSGLFVMDLDRNHQDGRDGVTAWKYLCQEKGDDRAELIASTARGGQHIIYRRPDVARITTTNNVVPASGIDVRGDGGYFIAPSECEPSRSWHTGDPFEDALPMAPVWVMKMVATDDVRASGNPDGGMYNKKMPLSPEEVSTIRDALSYIDNDDHKDWLKVGMALRSTGARDQALSIWAEWSESSPKWDEQAALKRWRSMREYRFDGTEIKLATLFAMARDGGWLGDAPLEFEPPSQPATPVETTVEDETVLEPFPVDLMNYPGAVSDLASACLRQSKHSPQPAFAFASALALVSAVLNRRVEDTDGTRTQLYIGILGATGCGKDAPLKFPGQVLRATGIERLQGRNGPANWTSDAAIRRELSKNPAMISAMDEVGLWIRKVHDPRATGADQSAKATFLELYSSSRGTTMEGTAYAQDKERPQVTLVEPSFTFLGASTPRHCFTGAGGAAIEDGFLNRFLFSHSDLTAPMPMDEEDVVKHVSMDAAVQIVTDLDLFFGSPSMLSVEDGSGPPPRPPHELRWSADAAEYMWKLDIEGRELRNDPERDPWFVAMLARRSLSIKRVAMVLAAGQDLGAPISLEAVEAAEKFVVWSQTRTLRECEIYVGTSEFEIAKNTLLRSLSRRHLGGFTKGDITKLMSGSRPNEVLDMMKSLGDAGSIVPCGDGKYRLA